MNSRKLFAILASALLTISTSVSATKAPSQDIKKVNAQGVIKFNVNMPDERHRKLNISTDALHFLFDDVTINTSPVIISGEQTKGSEQLWFGTSAIDINTLTIKDGKENITIKGLHLFHHNVDHGKKLDGTLNFVVGPMVDAQGSTQLTGSLKILGAKTAATKQMVELFQEMTERKFQPTPSFIFKAMPTLLDFYDGATIALTVKANHNKNEKIEASLYLQAAKNPNLLLGPEDVVKKSSGTMDFLVDQQTAQDIVAYEFKDQKNATQLSKKQLREYVQLGYIKLRGNDYIGHITLNSGKLLINGHLLVDMNAKSKQVGQVQHPLKRS